MSVNNENKWKKQVQCNGCVIVKLLQTERTQGQQNWNKVIKKKQSENNTSKSKPASLPREKKNTLYYVKTWNKKTTKLLETTLCLICDPHLKA